MGDNDSANQITMSYIDPPQIMVLDPQTQYYYWPPFGMEHASLQTLSEFLDSIINGTAPVCIEQYIYCHCILLVLQVINLTSLVSVLVLILYLIVRDLIFLVNSDLVYCQKIDS